MTKIFGTEGRTHLILLKLRVQRAYLEAIQELEPRVLEDLRDTVLPHCGDATPGDGFFGDLGPEFWSSFDDWCYRWYLYRMEEYDSDPEIGWFDTSGGSYPCYHELIRGTALATLHTWFTNGAQEPLRWDHSDDFKEKVFEETEQPVDAVATFQYSNWNPGSGEAREDAKRRLLAAFEEHLEATLPPEDQYKLPWGLTGGDLGFTGRIDKTVKKTGEDPMHHFKMLVRWNISEWTKPKIATVFKIGKPGTKRDPKTGSIYSEHSGVSGVRNVLEETSKLVDVALRRGTPGPRTKR